MNRPKPLFPTPLHQAVADWVVHFFDAHPLVDTILAVNSCARGVATPESDLDFAVLANEGILASQITDLEAEWREFVTRKPAFIRFAESSPWAHLHLDVIDGQFVHADWDEGGGPDYYEVEIGNRIAYSAPMGEVGLHFKALQAQWLPFYDEALRLRRLKMVVEACLFDLDHIEVYVRRGLHFQAFDKLYKAHQEFLQALFLSRKTYPIAYNKWIHTQVVEMLGLPEVYQALVNILSIHNLASDELIGKAELLRSLLQKHCRV